MACACRGRRNTKFVWTPADTLDGEGSITYSTEIQAKAKVYRDGGKYTAVEPAQQATDRRSLPPVSAPSYDTGI